MNSARLVISSSARWAALPRACPSAQRGFGRNFASSVSVRDIKTTSENETSTSSSSSSSIPASRASPSSGPIQNRAQKEAAEFLHEVTGSSAFDLSSSSSSSSSSSGASAFLGISASSSSGEATFDPHAVLSSLTASVTTSNDPLLSDTDARIGYTPDAIPPRTDPTLELFTNLMMKHGKKAEAERMVAEILRLLRISSNADPLPLIHEAVDLASPSVRMITLRKAAKNIQVPSALDARQRARQGITWILKAAERGRGDGRNPRTPRIAKEIAAVLDGTSSALQRKEEVHKLATANRSNLNSR